jgi:osmotically-inducible protein OsmY
MKRMLGVGTAVVAALVLGNGITARADDEPAGRELMRTEKQIQANLQGDRDLGDNRIDVQVSEGVATLKGTVDSDIERSQAVRLASVAGIRVVDDQLKVASAGVGATVSDSAITTKIKGQLLANTALRKADISVNTNNGVVTLTGTAQSVELRQMAVDLARHTGGVIRVDNQMHVIGNPPSPPIAPSR